MKFKLEKNQVRQSASWIFPDLESGLGFSELSRPAGSCKKIARMKFEEWVHMMRANIAGLAGSCMIIEIPTLRA
jgi:hypothetical protein